LWAHFASYATTPFRRFAYGGDSTEVTASFDLNNDRIAHRRARVVFPRKERLTVSLEPDLH
jgi:hypothetical protein